MRIESCGSHHGPIPAGHVVVDVAELFADPHVMPELRELTAHDQAVIDNVRRQPGAAEFTASLFHLVGDIGTTAKGAVRVVLACRGGRHRAPRFAEDLAELGREAGWDVEVEHRDLAKPVVCRRR